MGGRFVVVSWNQIFSDDDGGLVLRREERNKVKEGNKLEQSVEERTDIAMFWGKGEIKHKTKERKTNKFLKREWK